VHSWSSDRLRPALTWVAAAVLIYACNKSPTSTDTAARVSARVAQAAAAVAGQDAPIADEIEAGKYLGFDTHTYPGTARMRAWRNAKNAPYDWVGYYLPNTPCHDDRSWSGKRDTLRNMGWGLAVVYVGQQTWNRTPRRLTPAQLAKLKKRGVTCYADYLSADRGSTEALDAIRKAEAEGFPSGTVVFLDIERTERLPARMRDYYKSWVATMLTDGRYVPGVYVHSYNASDVYADVKSLFEMAGRTDAPRFWVASARDFSPDKAPQEVGHDFAGMWQGAIDVVRRVANIALPIDINVSNWPSPSDVTD
jgi:hypothetical protein